MKKKVKVLNKEQQIKKYKKNKNCNVCKHSIHKKGDSSLKCWHKNRKTYYELERKYPVCGRLPNKKPKSGCGLCTGRGMYIYWSIYNECDCGGFEFEEGKYF